jgi:hypothetical protein
MQHEHGQADGMDMNMQHELENVRVCVHRHVQYSTHMYMNVKRRQNCTLTVVVN